MSKQFNYKFIASTDVSMIQRKLGGVKDDWDEFKWRQKRFEVHKKTKTIPLIFDKDFRVNNPTYHLHYAFFQKDLHELWKLYTTHFKKGFIIRALLVMLPAKSKIPIHIDRGTSLDLCRRTHIPIVTHKDVVFEVDGEKKHLKEGEIWEINNTNKRHTVTNNSNKDRIHLILDWMVK